MVMKRNAMRTNLRQAILKSIGRYIAIAVIIALGSAIFVGLRMTKADMVATGQVYMDKQNMFDLRLVTDYGWGRDQVDTIAQIDGLEDVEGVFYMDLIARQGDAEDDSVYRFYSMPDKINQLMLRSGRMPEAPNECLADGYQTDESIIGSQVTVSQTNEEDSLESLNETTFTIVGLISSPLYMDMNRGTTSVGNGSLTNYYYVPEGAFDVDYYTEIHVTIPGNYAIYSEAYNDAMENMADYLEPILQPFADERLVNVKLEAEEAYADGYAEYQDGLQEYYDGVHEAYDELRDAYWELKDGEQELADGEQKILDGQEQIADAREALAEAEKKLAESKLTLANAKVEAYDELTTSMTDLTEQLESISTEQQEIEAELAVVEAEILAVDAEITVLETRITTVDANITATKLSLDLAEQNGDAEEAARLRQELAEYEAEKAGYEAELDPLYAEKSELELEKARLDASLSQYENTYNSLLSAMMEITVKQAMMEAHFASAQAQLDAGEAQIESSYLQLEEQEQSLADALVELEEGRQELADGWIEFEDGKKEMDAELADAKQELADGRAELADARKTIDDMTEISLHIMDRNTNVGYSSLDSASDIVQGVSKIFPVFFLLVAALVCITTMTRMVDEERTQIGTLKALGYSNNAIMSKYLIYAGSSALLGCGLGVLVGSAVFPRILWEAYKIMLYIQDSIVLTFDIWLCLLVVGMYTTVELMVTWYCCRKALEEVPAELIRPKAPDAGKQLLFEKLKFWNKISFLNKVTIRNIFRYRQRLAMMMVGIGGCTALLVTGFGLRDSIVGVVDYQFQEVTTYDLQVYFSEDQNRSEQAAFLAEVSDCAETTVFYHQSSVELHYDNNMREIFLVGGDESIQQVIDMHSGGTQLAMPGMNEVVLSVGVAEILGVQIGDQVEMLDSDMRSLELTVSGMYDNHVNNYAIVNLDTIASQWGTAPDVQMAFIKLHQEQDAHKVSAELSDLDAVMNVSVSKDLADMVSRMMKALDLVVWVVVVCAGLLAATVLYNLTNININERIREIATIKVLGFNASETGAYVFKENMSLTVAGSIFGLFLGRLLLAFVMSNIKIDFVWFKAVVEALSYLLAMVLTILSAILVDFVFYFKLDKINMAEALKSVE